MLNIPAPISQKVRPPRSKSVGNITEWVKDAIDKGATMEDMERLEAAINAKQDVQTRGLRDSGSGSGGSTTIKKLAKSKTGL